MTDMIYHGWSEVEAVVQNADAVKVPFGNNDVSFNAGFDVLPSGLKIPARGGAYLARIAGTWGWQSVPVGGFATVQLVHVVEEGVNEVPLINHETNSAHESDGYGDLGFSAGSEINKLGLLVVEGPGYFELRASQSAHATPPSLTVELVLVKL